MRRSSPITALACLTLAACSTTPPAAQVPAPANLTAPCPKLAPLAKGATFGDLLEAGVEAAGLYRSCANRHAALAKLVTP